MTSDKWLIGHLSLVICHYIKKPAPIRKPVLFISLSATGHITTRGIFSSIQAMVEGGVPPIILAQLNGFKPFDVDANLASTIV